MIILVIVFLVGLYFLKIAFPSEFVMVITNPQLIMIGNYVDTHLWLHICLGIITSFITYWLYLCATTRKWYLNWIEIIIVVCICVLTQVLFYWVDVTLASTLSLCAMICLPIISKAKLTDVAMVFTVHSVAQVMSIKIRGLAMLLTDTNYATIFLMGIESYFWLLLFYLYFNLKGKN